MIDWTYHARSDLASRIGRRLKRWRNVAPVEIACRRPIVTFTFDDFPKSALDGADIVETFGGRAGFYACTSMAGESGPYGEMFDSGTLQELQARGHEIGAHSHSHIDISVASTAVVLKDVEENLRGLHDLGVEDDIVSFAYPFGETRYTTQTKLAERFETCRGVAPGVNSGVVDRSHLRAYELNPFGRKFEAALEAIESLKANPGWIILFSHDVSTDPTEFGVSKRDLSELCKRAVDAGAALLTPAQASSLVGAGKI